MELNMFLSGFKKLNFLTNANPFARILA